MSEPQRGPMSGVYPRVGDLAWLSLSASILYREDPTWFRVLGVRPASIDGWAYLEGYHADERRRALRLVFIRVEGLVIRRDQ